MKYKIIKYLEEYISSFEDFEDFCKLVIGLVLIACTECLPIQELEAKIASFHGKEDAILYASCFDANAGIFEVMLTPEDAVLSDELNHASIIDGIRLCKAQKWRYKHRDLADLEAKLKDAKNAR